MRKLPLLVALGAMAFAAVASASVAIALSVEDLTARADLVVRGHVTGQESAWTRGGRIATTVHLAVDAKLKGEAPDAVDIRHLGGHVGDIGQQVTGEVAFTQGEEVVVFLRRIPSQARFVVVGMSQGKFSVDRRAGSVIAAQHLEGLGLRHPDGRVEDKPGEQLPLSVLEQRITQAAAR